MKCTAGGNPKAHSDEPQSALDSTLLLQSTDEYTLK